MPWLALAYPMLAHLGVVYHNVLLQWIALRWLLIIVLAPALMRRRIWAWITFFLTAVALYFLTMHGDGLYALYLPPIAIPLFILWLFGRTLRNDAKPLVSQIAETMRGEPLPDVLRLYTRRITYLWCGVAALLAVSATTTALFASAEVWSLLTNVIHYVVLGAVFVIEFIYRRIKYADLEPWTLMGYLRRLARVRIRM